MAVPPKFYVYQLIDPRVSHGAPFYVGKGSTSNVKECYNYDSRLTNHTKVVLRDIKLSGQLPIVKIISQNLTEGAAIELEASLIKKHGRITKTTGGILTNVFVRDRTTLEHTNDIKYATIQIREDIKKQVVDFCNRKGLKIGRFIESIFIQAVSGSTK